MLLRIQVNLQRDGWFWPQKRRNAGLKSLHSSTNAPGLVVGNLCATVNYWSNLMPYIMSLHEFPWCSHSSALFVNLLFYSEGHLGQHFLIWESQWHMLRPLTIYCFMCTICFAVVWNLCGFCAHIFSRRNLETGVRCNGERLTSIWGIMSFSRKAQLLLLHCLFHILPQAELSFGWSWRCSWCCDKNFITDKDISTKE